MSSVQKQNLLKGSIHFTHLSLEDGLSQSVVYSIFQDKAGFLWFGTEDGLNRYDGYSFTVYKPDPDDPDSLNDGWITTIVEDTQGYIWFGTRLGGLNRYDPHTGIFAHFMHDPSAPDSLSSNTVIVAYVDRSGILWVGTDKGLNKFEPQTEEFIRYQYSKDDFTSLSNDYVRAIYQDEEMNLWVGTNNGLNRHDTNTNSFTRFQHIPSNIYSLSRNQVSSITEDSYGSLWVGTYGGGLNRFNSVTETFYRYQYVPTDPNSLLDDKVYTLFVDHTGGLWVGTNQGLDYYDESSDHFIHFLHNPALPNSLSSGAVRSILEDRGGLLWVGTYGGGVSKYNLAQNFDHIYHDPNDPESLSDSMVTQIYVDHTGMVWIGTLNGGINRYDPRSGSFKQYRHEPDNPGSLNSDQVVSVLVDRFNILWAGTANGLERLDPFWNRFVLYQHDDRNPFSLAGSQVNVLFEDSRGELWVGSDRGLDRFNLQSASFTHFLPVSTETPPVVIDEVVSIYEDHDGVLWVGTFNNGLHCLDLDGNHLAHYLHDLNDPASLSHNSVIATYQDKQGNTWVGTLGGGLSRYDPANDSFRHYTEKNGLPNNSVYGILEDEKGYLWFSTNYGLSQFDPVAETFHNYAVSDGLQSNEFNMGAYAAGKDGYMYFGGINGITVFQPLEVKDNQYLPPIALTSLSQNGQLVPASKGGVLQDVTLKWPQNSFEFEFAALSYVQPSKNQYAYMLENFEDDWNYIGTKRTGRYTNLPGGTYTLRLKGTNNDGLWNEANQVIKVTVVPPFWGTWIFRILVGIFVVALGFTAYAISVRNIRARNLQLGQLVQERTSALQKRTDAIEALYSGEEKIIRSLTLEQIFRAIVEVAVNKLHADHSMVLCWDENQSRVIPIISHGFSESALSVIHYAKGEGMVGEVLETGKTIVIDDLDSEALRPDIRAAIVAEGIRSFVHIPIKVDEQVIGVFNVGFTQPNAITEDTVRLFTALAQRAGLSIQNMQLFEQTKELAVIEERNRVARELHDSAKQKAFAALAQLGTVNGTLKTNPDNARFHLGEAENLVYEVIQELTFLIQEMYPMALKEKGLATILREYVFEWENRNGILIDLDIKNARRMELETEQAIYRIVQEALANVARHSRADQVSVSLVFDSDHFIATISDNGLGFDVKQKALGMGLRTIRERAERVGGSAVIESVPEGGTKVFIKVPINDM